MIQPRQAYFASQVWVRQPWLQAAVLLATLLIGGMPASADDVRIGGFWITDVEITAIDGEFLFYETAAGAEVSQVMDQVQGIRLSAFPGYEQAAEQMEAGEPQQAVAILEDTLQQARADWQRTLILHQLLRAAREADNADVAVRAYVQLVQLNDSAYFMENPPEAMLAAMPEAQRRRLGDVIREAISDAGGDARPALESLLEIAEHEGDAPPREQDDASSDRQTMDRSVARDQPAADAAWRGTLPDSLRLTNIVEIMRAGNFEQARETLESALSNPSDLAEKLYLLGMIQLVDAENGDNPELYKDAAISFMRVVIHFPPGNRLRVPALVENAYCHYRFGRPDRAMDILSQVRNLISEEDYPQYYPRYREVREMIESGG